MESQLYVETLKSIEEKAPLESGVQALVYMLVFEILKKKEQRGNKLDIVIIDKMQNRSVFMSYGGISDIAIVDNDFNYDKAKKDKIKLCIEVKFTNKSIKGNAFEKQVKMQLLTYKKAIITNGKEWIFYELDSTFDIYDEAINEVIKLERQLAARKGELKSLSQTRTNSFKKNECIKDIDEKIKDIRESITKLDDEISEKRKKLDGKIKYESIKPKKEDCFIIDDKDDSFIRLCNKIDQFIAY